jgi:hypothetical protein
MRKKGICALLELFVCVFQVELNCANMKDEEFGICNDHLIDFGRCCNATILYGLGSQRTWDRMYHVLLVHVRQVPGLDYRHISPTSQAPSA